MTAMHDAAGKALSSCLERLRNCTEIPFVRHLCRYPDESSSPSRFSYVFASALIAYGVFGLIIFVEWQTAAKATRIYEHAEKPNAPNEIMSNLIAGIAPTPAIPVQAQHASAVSETEPEPIKSEVKKEVPVAPVSDPRLAPKITKPRKSFTFMRPFA